MKKSVFFLTAFYILSISWTYAQGAPQDSRVITTGVPFLTIAADARAAGMGDQGVATAPDGFSQQWNPAKFAFIEQSQAVGITYTPYLSELVNDIFLGSLNYYNRINEQSAFAASFRYFSLGDIEFRDTADQVPLIQSPNEFTFDVSYALRLDPRFSMAVAGRYLRSDLRLTGVDGDTQAAGSFGVDIAGYYQSEEIPYNTFDGRWRAGFNFSNLGPKIKYDEAGQENFIPSNMRLGGGFDFILDGFNTIAVGLEFNKLLVPTPPVRDENGDVIAGEDDDVSFITGIFQSFGDAPDGFSEELKEFTWSLGTEYSYDDKFLLRAGYFNESDEKGGRKFATLGAGFKLNVVDIDVSYLFSTSNVTRSPLERTLRFSLTFNFGDEYVEY
ncbi:type IX secretion system outer membrane channel protein PorV [Croceiramulus getboli]|nr:type IX secretion system outer membrane channel protein PorV [Flavobacteriaceae bacterium YJPT1-3]